MFTQRKGICLFIGLSLFVFLSNITAEEIDRAKVIKEIQVKLNYTKWQVKLTPPFIMLEQTKPLETDVIEFGSNNVLSKNLDAIGFPRSNYSLRIKDDGTAVWETMKTSGKGVIIFLRGELKGDSMRGVLSLPAQAEKKIPAKSFSFVSTSRKKLEIPEEEVKRLKAERARTSEEVKKVEEKKVQKEEEKPKKKRWWQ